MKKNCGEKENTFLSGILRFILAALPALPAGAAEEIYCLGEVDMDHVITGHDAAMVTQYLNVDPHLLTEEQLMLADVFHELESCGLIVRRKQGLGRPAIITLNLPVDKRRGAHD